MTCTLKRHIIDACILLHPDTKSTCAVIISLTTAQNTSSLYAFIILGSDIYSLFLLQEFVLYNYNTHLVKERAMHKFICVLVIIC